MKGKLLSAAGVVIGLVTTYVVLDQNGVLEKVAPRAQIVTGMIRGGDLVPCFTPGQDCTSFITARIGVAERSVLVQAYSFTAPEIAQALAAAKARGVDVRVILDGSQETDRYSVATYFQNHGLTPLIDDQVAAAHNKVIVVDGRDVFTGSFNFTRSAQSRNAENVLLVANNPALAKAYIENWERRAAVSRPYRSAATTN
ncbi:phospholipase D family protein [Inquilinus sp. NPDC058860]|uniref:phospholipase D family nuclease n=1 Tax=Inquilinus sp. NPDC058860 TaxID=3346652 RepID=UPI0036865DC5